MGVIGEDSSRDGFRHSRILKGNSDGYEVFTLDHDTGELRLDLSFNYSSKDSPQPEPIPPPEELLCHPNSGLPMELVNSVFFEQEVQLQQSIRR